MDAKDHPVISVLGDQRRFVVPIFQRQYSWGEARLAPFWEDVVAKAEEALQGKPKFSHYMGALILAPGGDGFIIGVTPRVQVIDGQQRLTTFQLFLAALREVAQRIDVPDFDSLVHSYLHVPPMRGDTAPDATFRLIPTPEDRAVFHLIVGQGLDGVRSVHPQFFYQNGNVKKGAAPNSVRAFAFFIDRIEQYAKFGIVDQADEATPSAGDDSGDVPTRMHALLQALLNHLKLVVITLSEDDDAQVIFETLNSKAEPLLAMDLVRNNIFHRASAQGESVENLFNTKWRVFDSDGPFWKADSPRAKPKRPRIDHFLSHSLTAQTGEESSLRELYAEYRAFTRLNGRPRFQTVEAELAALIAFAPVYRELEESSGDSDLAWLGRKLSLWEVSTAYPLAFRIAVSQAEAGEKRRLYGLIYSYLVRRALCGLTPKSLNKTFARLTRLMIESGVSVDTFKAGFADQRGDAVRFPDDGELSAAIRSKPAYHMLARKERLAELLWDLEIATRDKFTVNTPRPANMSVEHIMPQAWTNHWTLDDGRKVPTDKVTGVDDTMQREIQARDGAVNTLGNLTLLTPPGNTVASDSALAEKARWLSEALLALNLEILKQAKEKEQEPSTWNVAKIAKRSEVLAGRATSVWPAP
jgi:hypothetical protein